LQKQLQAAGAAGGGYSEAAKPQPEVAKQPLISDFWYDVAGWVCLVGIGFGIAALSSRSTSA